MSKHNSDTCGNLGEEQCGIHHQFVRHSPVIRPGEHQRKSSEEHQKKGAPKPREIVPIADQVTVKAEMPSVVHDDFAELFLPKRVQFSLLGQVINTTALAKEKFVAKFGIGCNVFFADGCIALCDL
ncbi:unnamed protein product [Meganyctiphanes norvegica]|uniref:Uncharacterized protein n=1 Tax=Meganyctiphanes norvegica TaxID=48144 RepID=A0AAV2S0V8_MEGNR